MDLQIAAILLVDGITNGAVYALLAMAIVLVFSVTRIIHIPQGEYVALGALTLGMFQQGGVPGTVWLLLALAALCAALEAYEAWRAELGGLATARVAVVRAGFPALVAGAALWLAPQRPSLLVQALLTVALVTCIGPLTYRIAFRRVADASVLLLLIVSVGVHFTLLGLGLLFFGAEGFRTPSFWDVRHTLGSVPVSGQAIVIVLTTGAGVVALFLFFDRMLWGRALRATAVNRTGARLVGISTETAGALSFGLAAFIGALSGLLIGPTTTVFYDSGFLIGLKGFVAAVFAGLGSFPAALAGAMLVGVVEAFGAFWSSAFKEVIVFTAILPVLLWRSMVDRHVEEH
jgi:branched-chain amino acid transport system permease protein